MCAGTICGSDQVWKARRETRLASSVQVADRIIRADARQAKCGVLLITRVGDENDFVADLGDHAAGFCEAAVEISVVGSQTARRRRKSLPSRRMAHRD